jgi:hypothetical protein
MLPAAFLLAITLPFMAAVELHFDTFVILMIVVCVAAGLTAPVRGGHADIKKRRPIRAPDGSAREPYEKPCSKTATRLRESSLVG